MSNLLFYKNYNGMVKFSKEDSCFFRKLIGIKSLLSYEGNSVSELEEDFQNVIDECLNAFVDWFGYDKLLKQMKTE